MIKKTMVGNATGSEIFQCDTIDHEGLLWLVPEWLHNQEEGWMQPARIIQMSGLQYQETLGSPIGDYILNGPIPKAVFDGETAYAGVHKYRVIEQPDIRIPTGGVH